MTETDTETQREREREREQERQRQRNRERQRKTERETDRETEKEREIYLLGSVLQMECESSVWSPLWVLSVLLRKHLKSNNK